MIDENSLRGVAMKHLLFGKRQRMGGSEVKQKLYKLKKPFINDLSIEICGGHDPLDLSGYAYGSMCFGLVL